MASASPQAVSPRLTAALFGRVSNGLTHEPVRRAFVKIYNDGQQWDSITDGEGRFTLPPLPRAEYSLVTHRDGYTDRYYKVELSDFDQPKELPLELLPQGVITGKVVDGLGQPLKRVEIVAISSHAGQGRQEILVSAETTDLGDYRLSGLDPGSYKLRATYREGRESELDPTPLTIATVVYGGPGTPAEFAVKPGQVIDGIDFVLIPVRPVKVRGTVRAENGQAIEEASVWIEGSDTGSSAPAGNGKFEIQDVRPGTYKITAKASEGAAPLYGQVSVEVRGQDVNGVELVLHPISQIVGQILAPGVDATALKRVLVLFFPSDPNQVTGMEFGRSSGEGAFEAALPPGEYTLMVQSLPSNFVVQKVTLGDELLTNWKVRAGSFAESRRLVIVLGPEKRP